tara:strand:+ start:467 stop:700 length:234 start_codon:yes stop_codon:yes gene_type:complete
MLKLLVADNMRKTGKPKWTEIAKRFEGRTPESCRKMYARLMKNEEEKEDGDDESKENQHSKKKRKKTKTNASEECNR